MLSQNEINNYPVKLTQQQLLLLNSFSNRVSWLFDDISKLGVPMQTLQPHVTALQRMVTASREIQCKLQSFVRKHRMGDSSVTPESERSVDIQAAEREKTNYSSSLRSINALQSYTYKRSLGIRELQQRTMKN